MWFAKLRPSDTLQRQQARKNVVCQQAPPPELEKEMSVEQLRKPALFKSATPYNPAAIPRQTNERKARSHWFNL